MYDKHATKKKKHKTLKCILYINFKIDFQEFQISELNTSFKYQKLYS